MKKFILSIFEKVGRWDIFFQEKHYVDLEIHNVSLRLMSSSAVVNSWVKVL